MAWLDVSGFCYTTDDGLSLGLLLDILILSCVVEILLVWICSFDPFVHFNMKLTLWWANSQSWFWVWLVAGSVFLPASPHLHYRASSPALPLLAHTMQPTRSGVRSPALRSSNLGHPHSRHQSQLYCFDQTRCRTCPPNWNMGGGGGVLSSSVLMPSGLTHSPTPKNKFSSRVLPRQSAWSSHLVCGRAGSLF